MSNGAASRKEGEGAGRFSLRALVNCLLAVDNLTKALESKRPVPLTPFLEAAVLLIQSFLNTMSCTSSSTLPLSRAYSLE